MVQISILNGIYTDNGPDFRTSYPVNMIPVPKGNGISEGFLRPADGVVSNGTGPGIDRGGINWNGVCYRVMGSKLVSVSATGTVTILGDVGDDGQLVTMDYSFDRLAIASSGHLFYWSPSLGLVQVTDADIGVVIDVVWVDGYFMTTDGEFLIVTELLDPTQVNPLKYGSSEVDPDPVIALLKLRNEIYALNRNTIEVFDNVGAELFPFQRIDGAQIQKGCVGTFACCVFVENIAFVGGGRNESPGIYMGANATANKISTQEIDQILLQYTEEELALVKLEARNDKAHQHLYVHLPDRTIVFDASASQELNQPVWFTLTSSIEGFSKYRAQNLVWCYDKWLVGDPTDNNIGYFVDNISTQWGQTVRWEFGTTIVYNEGRGAIFSELELVGLTGRVPLGSDPYISTSYSIDGETWSQPKSIKAGKIGQRQKRLVWFQQGWMRNWRIQRFQGTSDAHIACARLEARIEALAF
jgi:Phage stabilisation protein